MLYNSKVFGLVISRLRLRAGFSQEHASALAGLSRSHWAALEKGAKILRADTLWSVAYALDIAPHELVRLTEEEMAAQRGEGRKGG